MARPVRMSSRGLRLAVLDVVVNLPSAHSRGLAAIGSWSSPPIFVPGRCAPNASRNCSWSSSGTPSRSATASRVERPGYTRSRNSHLPSSMNSSIWLVGEPPDAKVLVLLQPFRGQQPALARTGHLGWNGRIHRDHVLVHRDLGTMLDPAAHRCRRPLGVNGYRL